MPSGPRIVRFRGRDVPVPEGGRLLDALGGPGAILQRSIRYHRPRAPFCGVGHCANCLVRVNGTPNVRACTFEPAAGDRVQTENAWPSPRHDLWRLFDYLFPRGVDTTRGLRRPAFAAPIYQRVVRRLAGFGRIPTPSGAAPAGPPEPLRSVDCLIIGAGRAGAALARERVATGHTVEVLDRRSAGENLPGATVHWGTAAIFLPVPGGGPNRRLRVIAARKGGPGVEFRAAEVVVAVGGYDANLWFTGGDTPGVMTAEGALAFAGESGPPPFRKALVFGTSSQAARLLARFGPAIDALAAPGPIEPELVGIASTIGVDLYPRSLLADCRGTPRVRSVRLAPRAGGAPFDLSVDAVILAHRRLPNVQLFFQAGAQMRFDRPTGAYFPVLDARGATTVPALSAAGSCAAPRAPGPAAPVPEGAPGPYETYYRELFAHPRPRGKFVVCACEDVLLGEVEEAHERGFRGIEVIKRYTGLGTGLCQGRYCVPEALAYLSILERRTPQEVGYLTQRPPVMPVPLGALAALPVTAPEEGAP